MRQLLSQSTSRPHGTCCELSFSGPPGARDWLTHSTMRGFTSGWFSGMPGGTRFTQLLKPSRSSIDTNETRRNGRSSSHASNKFGQQTTSSEGAMEMTLNGILLRRKNSSPRNSGLGLYRPFAFIGIRPHRTLRQNLSPNLTLLTSCTISLRKLETTSPTYKARRNRHRNSTRHSATRKKNIQVSHRDTSEFKDTGLRSIEGRQAGEIGPLGSRPAAK